MNPAVTTNISSQDASSSNYVNPSNTTVNKTLHSRPTIIGFEFSPFISTKATPSTPPSTPPRSTSSTPSQEAFQGKTITPIKSGSRDTNAIPSTSVTPSKQHLKGRSSSFSSPSLKPLPQPPQETLETIPFNINYDELSANLRAMKGPKKAFSRTKAIEPKAESSTPALGSTRSFRQSKGEEFQYPSLQSSSSFRSSVKEEKPLKKVRGIDKLKNKANYLLENFLKADKEDIRKTLISMRCIILNLKKKYIDQVDNRRKSIGLSGFETDDLAFDDTKSIVHLKIAEFFDDLLLNLSKGKDFKNQKSASKLLMLLPVDKWEKPRTTQVLQNYAESLLEFKKLIAISLEHIVISKILSEKDLEMIAQEKKIDKIVLVHVNNLNKTIKESIEEAGISSLEQSEAHILREYLVRYKEIIDNLNLYLDDLKACIDHMGKKDKDLKELIVLEDKGERPQEEADKRTSRRKSSRKSSIAPGSRASVAVGSVKNIVDILNKMLDEIEKLELSQKKIKGSIVLLILEQVNKLITTTEDELFPDLPKRTASEFNYLDIQHLLFEKKFLTSAQHDNIIKVLRKNLLNLKRTIPSDKCKKKSNEKALFRWIDKKDLPKRPIVTLLRYKKQMGNLIQLLKDTRDKFAQGEFPSILTKEQIDNLSATKKLSKLLITIYNEINSSIFENQEGKLVTWLEEILIRNRQADLIKRYPQIISILENYHEIKLKAPIEYLASKIFDAELLKRVRDEICGDLQLGSSGTLLSEIKKNPTKDLEWTYTLENAALKVLDEENKDCLFPITSETIPTIGDKRGEDLNLAYTTIQQSFNTLISLFEEQMQIDATALGILKRLFGLTDDTYQKMDMFDNPETLKEFISSLGFDHHFNLQDKKLMALYQYVLKEGFIDTEDGRSKIVEQVDFDIKDSLSAVLLFNELKKISQNDPDPYKRFDSFGQVLKLIAMDKENAQSEEITRLVHLFQFVNQESAYANKNSISALYWMLDEKSIFASYKGFKTTKNPELDKNSKKYQIKFSDNAVIRSATSIHSILSNVGDASMFFRERYEIESGQGEIHQSDNWITRYSGTIIIKKQILKDNEVRVLEDLEMVLGLLGIEYNIVFKA